MSFSDLNVIHPASPKTLETLEKLGYGTVAINQLQTGKLNPNEPIRNLNKNITAQGSGKMKVLSRVTLTLEDTSINYNLVNTTKEFDILAVRPTTEKTLQHVCTSMDVDIISLDLSGRLPYYLKHSTLGSATSRGVYLEICYGASLLDDTARRQLFSNAANMVRATRGRGLIISSEAVSALGLRGPFDVVNLATFWGLNQERGRDTVAENARRVLVKASTRKGVHKGVLRITQRPEPAAVTKRAAPEAMEEVKAGGTQPLSRKKQKQLRKNQVAAQGAS